MLLLSTKYFRIDPWYCGRAPHVADLGELSHELLKKAHATLGALAQILSPTPTIGARNALLAVVATFGAARVVRAGGPRRIVLFVVLAFTCAYVGVHLFLALQYRYIAFAFPPMWILACVAMRDIAERLKPRFGRARAVPSILVAATLVAPEVARVYGGKEWVIANALPCPTDALCNRDEIVAVLRTKPASNVLSGGNRPWDLALAVEQRVAPLLEKPEDLARLRDAGMPFDLLLVPANLSFAGDGARPRGWAVWGAIRDARLPYVEGLALDHVFADGSVLYARAPDAPSGVAYCDLHDVVDVRLDDARRHLGETFRYTERRGDEAWTWVQGRDADIALVGCRETRRLRLTLIASDPPPEVDVIVEERHVGRLRFDAPLAWQEFELVLPEGARNGVVSVALHTDSRRRTRTTFMDPTPRFAPECAIQNPATRPASHRRVRSRVLGASSELRRARLRAFRTHARRARAPLASSRTRKWSRSSASSMT
jgi:hypothetical protein